LKLTTIAFEPLYEEKKNYHVHIKSFMSLFLLTLFLFFYLSISLSRWKNLGKDEDPYEIQLFDSEGDIADKMKKKDFISRMSNETIKGTYSTILFNGVFSLIFSIFYLSGNSTNLKEYIFENNMNIIFMPILMDKFYYFTLNYYCLYTSEINKKFDLIPSSKLFSFYLLALDIILWIIKLIVSLNATDTEYFQRLVIIQIVISVLPSLFILFYLLIGILSSCNLHKYCPCEDCKEIDEDAGDFLSFCYCLFTFAFCLGGCWFKQDAPLYCGLECCCCDPTSCCYCEFWDNIEGIYCDCCCPKKEQEEQEPS
jgi:hypothetical protein